MIRIAAEANDSRQGGHMHAWLGTWDASKRPTEVVACKRAFPGQQLSEESEYVSPAGSTAEIISSMRD